MQSREQNHGSSIGSQLLMEKLNGGLNTTHASNFSRTTKSRNLFMSKESQRETNISISPVKRNLRQINTQLLMKGQQFKGPMEIQDSLIHDEDYKMGAKLFISTKSIDRPHTSHKPRLTHK